MKVAIIGGGVAGLAAARRAIEKNMECDVFEMWDQIGGTWVYSDETEKDKYGYAIHSSMYKGLRTNIPKETMEFPGFPMPKSDISYLTQPEVLAYINSFADYFKLRPLVKLNTIVTDVRPIESGWQVTYRDKPTGTETANHYDAVMVCNGHYSECKIPKILGSEHFKGEISHSHYYRYPEVYRGKRVLVIGAGPSGRDITMQLSKIATRVVLSHHLPKSISMYVNEKPDVKCIRNNGELEFIDGTTEMFDTIIFATGYIYTFPFLHKSCGISVEDDCVKPLYKHLINIENPTMCFLGIPAQVAPFPLVDLQARYFLKSLEGSFKLPDAEKMLQHTEWDLQRKMERGWRRRMLHVLGNDYEFEYSDDIASEAQITPIPRVISKLKAASVNNGTENPATFRERNFRIIDDENYEEIYPNTNNL